MAETNEDLLSIDHFACFGGIIHSFARLEYLIQVTMAAVADVDDLKILLLTKALSYSQKRDTLYSYLENFKMKNEDHETAIKSFLDRANKYNVLRTNIAHALWREGTRPNSIRAGYIDIRRGKGKIVGYDEDDKDYTAPELAAIADELRGIQNGLIRYLRDCGISVDIAEKIEITNK